MTTPESNGPQDPHPKDDEATAANPPTSADEPVEEGPPPTPFDHPLFLPVILAGLTLWFGYDGFLNPEIESVMFNRVGFGILLVLSAWYGFRAYQEMREIKEQEAERERASD